VFDVSRCWSLCGDLGDRGGFERAGRLALKPVEFLAETLWRAEALSQLSDSTEFRVGRLSGRGVEAG
jgi:hypothetical protein